MTTLFFQELSKYYDKENDLSNVTCALCNSSMIFREKFIHFFFPELNIESISSIKREVCDTNNMHSRVDLYIEMSDDTIPYLIEVKIYDKNHHFGQYEKAYCIPKERLGYITNYYCKEGIEQGYDVKTWSDWFNCLTKTLPTLHIEDKRMCIGYLEYLKNVCDFSELVESLDFNSRTKDNFFKLCKFVIGSGYTALACKNNGPFEKNQVCDIIFFSFLLDAEIEVGAWIGVKYTNKVPSLCIGINKIQKNADVVFSVLNDYVASKSKIHDVIVHEKFLGSQCHIIPMQEKFQKDFLKCKSPQKQSEVLLEFLNECLGIFAIAYNLNN